MGVAQGARIRSTDVCAIMRRINALEGITFERGSRKKAREIAVDNSGDVHVQIETFGVINKYNNTGVFLLSYTSPGETLQGWGGDGHIYMRTGDTGTTVYRHLKDGSLHDSFSFPSNRSALQPSIAIDGFIYATLAVGTPSKIYQYDADGTELDSANIATPPTSAVYVELAIDSTGDVYAFEESGDDTLLVFKYDNTLTADSNWDVGSTIQVNEGTTEWAASSTGKTVLATASDRVWVFNSNGTADTDWAINSTATGRQGLAIDSSDLLYVSELPSGTNGEIHVYNLAGTEQASWNIYAYTAYAAGETTFYKYPTTTIGDKVSLGTPDGGVSIPALTALEGIIPRSNEVADMHDAVEAVLPNYKNVVTGNAFNFTNGSDDNLFHVAVEAGVYDWTETGAYKTIIREDLIDHLDLCVAKLEASDLV